MIQISRKPGLLSLAMLASLYLCSAQVPVAFAQQLNSPSVTDVNVLPDAPSATQNAASGADASAVQGTPAAVPALDGSAANAPDAAKGGIAGTVTDVNDDSVPGATVTLQGPSASDRRSVVANETGYFEFKDVKPGTSYHVTIAAKDFANWTSSDVVLKPGQFAFLPTITLHIEKAMTTINVGYSAEEVAVQQVKIEEQQRVFGIIPNFYVVYDHDAAPLTAKLKFRLAYKVATDPVTWAGVAFFAGINQAANTPDFQQGAKGYGQRFGTVAADGLTDIMIGGAILPSLLHQDPRYFYQGTGTKKSRALHAISGPFICKGDNGHLQLNYSTIGGDLASSAIANLYYPASNRGTGLIFQNLAITTAERMASSLVQEFILGKFTSKGKNPK